MQININSISNKSDQLKAMIDGKVKFLVDTATKLNPNFPTSYFHISNITKRYKLDRNRNGGEVFI